MAKAVLNRFAAAILFPLWLLVFPLVSLGGEKPVRGDSLVAASLGDARILIPFLADDTASREITRLVFSGLVRLDRDLNVVGELARSWETSADNLIITFHLHPDLRWHDGHPLTAADVKFTFESILDPVHACPYVGSYQDIDRIVVHDPLTISFHYREPFAPAMTKMGMEIVPRHLLEGVELRSSPFARSPVGSGPFRFKDWKTDEFIILDANPDYFEGQPYLDRYVTRIIPDQAVGYLELITGGVDLLGLSPYQYNFRSGAPSFRRRCEKYKYPAGGFTYVGYNLNDPLFSDLRVRKALGMAIDKERIIEGLLFGLGEPVTGPFWKGTWSYNDEVQDLPYDPRGARRLLEEAGWEAGPDGLLRKDGLPFRFSLVTNQGNKLREDLAVLLQRQWRSIGVRADIQVVAWPTFLGEFIDKKNFQAVILAWTGTVDPDPYDVWHSDSTRPGGLNFISYRNPEVDELIIQGRRTFDRNKRREIYHRVHELIAADQPYTFLFTQYALVAVDRRLRGLDPAPAGLTWNLNRWWVPEAEQSYRY